MLGRQINAMDYQDKRWPSAAVMFLRNCILIISFYILYDVTKTTHLKLLQIPFRYKVMYPYDKPPLANDDNTSSLPLHTLQKYNWLKQMGFW